MGVVLVFFGPIVAQVVCYFALARFVFDVPWNRAAGIAVVRVGVGLILFWVLVVLTLKSTPTVGEILLVSSPIAWAVAACLDPRRSIPRGLAWVLAGTALTFFVNEAFFRLLMDQSVLSTDTRWSFG